MQYDYDEACGPTNFVRHYTREWETNSLLEAVEIHAFFAPHRMANWDDIL